MFGASLQTKFYLIFFKVKNKKIHEERDAIHEQIKCEYVLGKKWKGKKKMRRDKFSVHTYIYKIGREQKACNAFQKL